MLPLRLVIAHAASVMFDAEAGKSTGDKNMREELCRGSACARLSLP